MIHSSIPLVQVILLFVKIECELCFLIYLFIYLFMYLVLF